jgi:protein SCO1
VAGRPAAPSRGDDPTRIFDGAFRLVVLAAAALLVLMVVRVVGDAMGPGGSGPVASGAAGAASVEPGASSTPAPSIDVDAYLEFFPRPAPPLELTGPGGGPVSLADFHGQPVLVFFGYTHCPDVCPVTVGAVGEAIDAYGGDAQAIFVSVDPERDSIPWLAEFVKYMPEGFTAVTGTPAEVRATADAWGVRYARVETGDPEAYSMSHTADVFVVDGAGQFRARLPFGTEVPAMTAVLREVAATTVTPTAAPTPSVAPTSSAPSPTPVADLTVEVVSSSVWAGGASPVILALHDATGRINDPTLAVEVAVLAVDGTPAGGPVAAVAVQPAGIADVSYVATVDIPSPGTWNLAVTAMDADGGARSGMTGVVARDPGGTAALGASAPTVDTPTAADFGGDLTWVTTDPGPDPRLSATSTGDALAAGQPFVLVVDSYSFKVTPACGKAVVMAKQLVHRWTDVPFIHHEPYRYTVVTTEPVLEGSLTDPRLTEAAEAWGVGSQPWGVGSMPWIFVVDGDGTVRAKYQGVMGSADVDVMLSLLDQEG